MQRPDQKDLSVLRHSAAHLLAHAVSELFPDTLMTIGPATEDGFFYDFLPQRNFTQDDLPIIEERMREISKRNLPLTHEQMSKDDARKLYHNNPFKLELINSIEGDTVGIARQGDFYDLCRGGHVMRTGNIKHFKLLGVSGSYWRADRNNQALQRISGTAFYDKESFDQFIQRREDAIRLDHRRLGKELDLFSFHEEGPGFPFFHAHGKTVLNIMTDFLRKKLQRAGYQEISTPTMLSEDLWKQSGHYDFYKNNMYFSNIDERHFAIKPMNCPGSILVYKERPRSYRELPLRLAEFGAVHRHELSGVLHGLFRTRSFTIDDGHLYCTPEQIEHEVHQTIVMVQEVLAKFGFANIKVALSTRPAKALGSDELWEKAINGLKSALDHAGITYTIAEGDGAFYGPKIEFRIEDSMGREWQCGTVQLDFFQPERFDLSYITPAGTRARPVMIHRAIYGSFERFFAILLEHYKGRLPFWIAPMQVKVLTITDDQKAYARDLAHELLAQGIRVQIDESSDPIAGQIKTAQLQQIPWMAVIGKKEVENNTVTLRYVDGKQEFGISRNDFIARAKKESVY